MGAMFGLIFANNLVWLFLFWEITTLCSFLLIGYTQTEEARRNALLALVMNLAGGLAFAMAIVWFYRETRSIELQTLINSRQGVGVVARGAAVFCGHHEIRATSVFKLAAGRDGRADAGLGVAAFEHDGEGGRLSGVAHGAGGRPAPKSE